MMIQRIFQYLCSLIIFVKCVNITYEMLKQMELLKHYPIWNNNKVVPQRNLIINFSFQEYLIKIQLINTTNQN